MSMSLVVLLPLIMLGIVGTLCFVGCAFQTGGIAPDFTAYTNTIRGDSNCIGYWPLKEAADTIPAAELISGNTGMYIDKSTAKPGTVYPWPAYSVPNGANPDVLSAAAAGDDMMGTIQFAQNTIVTGDLDLIPGDPAPPACMVVNGCYVEVPWKDKFIPKTTFTVEAWVRVDWTAGDPHAWRFVLDMREFSLANPVTTGFGIYAKADDNAPSMYHWAALVGDGSPAFVPIESAATIKLKDPAALAGTTVYLALTYDGTTLTLFVDGEQASSTASGYASNAAQVLWIGAGSPYTTPRMQPAGPDAASPLFPFVGAIQNVAIYNVALEAGTILTHFHDGQGTDDSDSG